MKRSFTLLTSLFLVIGSMWAQVFPEASSAESPKYYTIASYNRGGYLTNVGAGKGAEHIAITKGSLWYFTQADENGGLNFCNMAGGFLAADKTVSETAGVWYVLPNGVNTEGVSISSTNPITNGSCVDANNHNSGVGAWHPSASDWEGTTWVFAEVTDFSTIFNVDEAKAAAKAELDVLASVSVIYGDVAEAKANVDAVVAEGTSLEQLVAAIDAVNKCVTDYKNASYQALSGKYFTITTPARGNGVMKLDGNRVVGLATANTPAAIWQFEYVDGAVKVFNPYTEKYLCEPGGNSADIATTADVAQAAAYQLVINSAAEKEEAKVKLTSNGKSVHMSGGSVLVRWDNGGASEWTVAEVSDFAEIVSLHKAAALAAIETYSQLPTVFEAEAAKEAVNGVVATDWSAFAAIDAAASTVIPAGKFAFQATSTDNHRNLVWVSANMETSKAIGATEQDVNAHWTLKPASGGAFYIYNVANELYMGNPSGNCALTAEPAAAYTIEVIDAANNVVEFKCGGETLHASNHDDDKLMNYDGDEAASRWAIVAIEEEPAVDPNDYTSAIANADLSTGDAWNTDGTKGISGGMVKVASESAFNFSQTITLPAGQYKMTAKAVYRYTGSEAEEFAAIEAGTSTRLVNLYAETATYKYEVGVMNRYDGASDTDYAAGNGSVTVNGKFVPNSSSAVQTWFDNGQYVNELVFNVQEEGTVKIGLTRTGSIAGDYTNIGAWTLTRLGDAEADPEVEEPEEPETPEEPGETTDVDMTDKVNKNGWICENGKPNGVTIDGIAMQENFQDGQTGTSASTTGVVLWQDVTGLENGNYTVELWANARVAWQDSPATDGQEELTYLVANNVEISMKVFLNPGLNNNATYVLEGVEVTDGTLHIEMNKKAAGSNWHSIQIKSLTLHVSNNEALNLAKVDLQAALEAAAAVSPATEALTAAIAAAQNVYDNSKSVDEVNAAVATLKVATILAINTNSVAGATLIAPVATNFVVNGTFDEVIAPWKSTTGAQNQALATNQQGAFTGRFFENWNGSNYVGKLYQEIENIPNGLYELSICAFVETYNGAAQFVYANGDKKALTTGAPTAYTILTVVTNNTLEIGFEQTEAVNRWSGIDNASLKYFGEFEGGASMALISYEITKANAGALVGEKMAPETLEALNAAIAKEVDTTSDEALIAAEAEIAAAISAAKQSILLFANNKLAIDAMFALMESTNVYTVEAYEAYKAKAEDFLAQYEAGTLTTTVDNPATIHGWRAAVDYDDMLLSAFGVKDFDTNLYINTWSGEGETDGSEFKVPFFEYWVGDGESLGATTKTATVTGLTPGMCYSVEAWVRVRAKNGVAAADATGITLSVGEGEATDVTEGEVIGTSQFSHAVFTATGVADAEGNLTINFNVLDGNNVSWLSFKNLKYTEVEVVEPQHLPVVSAMAGDVEIVEGAATVESISSFEITFDRPVVKVEDAEWAQLTDKWGDNSLKAEVLEDNNCVVRFSLQWDVFTEAGDYYLYIPEGVVADAEDANCVNAAIEAVITIEAAPVEPATPLAVVNVTVGEDVMEGLTAVATTEDMIKINFDGKFYFQGSPVIVDAEGQEAPMAFEYMNGLDMDGSNSYILMGKTEGIYTITLPKSQFNELEMMGWKAPAEDIVLTVQITLPQGIDNLNADAELVIYDLSGRRVEKMEKGIYIVNGKKVIVK